MSGYFTGFRQLNINRSDHSFSISFLLLPNKLPPIQQLKSTEFTSSPFYRSKFLTNLPGFPAQRHRRPNQGVSRPRFCLQTLGRTPLHVCWHFFTGGDLWSLVLCCHWRMLDILRDWIHSFSFAWSPPSLNSNNTPSPSIRNLSDSFFHYQAQKMCCL